MITKSAGPILAAALGFLIASCTPSGQANTENRRVVRAHTDLIQLQTIPDQFEAPGTIRARTSTVLSSKIVGQIVSLNVHEGDRVRHGQVLVEIDNREATAQLRRANAATIEAQRALEEADRTIHAAEASVAAAQAGQDLAASTRKRYEFLRERRSVSPQEYDEVETRHKAAILETDRARESLEAAKARSMQIAARIEQATAESDSAQIAQGYSRILSPIDGIVTARHLDPGALATPGIPILAVEDDRTYELEVPVEESRVGKIVVGQRAHIAIDALPGRVIDAKVGEIIPSSDPSTRTYAVKLQIEPTVSLQTLRSGFFGRALFSAGDRQVLVVSQSALTRRGQLEGVYVVENEIALLRLVKTGKQYGQNVEILSGLAPGMRIVATTSAEVSDGVKIINEDASRSTP